MAGEPERAELAVERFREYLLLFARVNLGEPLRGKLDASDIVQQTLLDAHRQRQQFRGQTAAEMAGWLRRMLACNLADAVRALRRDKRDVGRERSLDVALDESASRLDGWLAAEQSSPSEHVIRSEEALRTADALTKLPDAQRDAIVLHYWQGMTLAQVGEQLGRTPAAVAGLLQRGLKTLRSLLSPAE